MIHAFFNENEDLTKTKFTSGELVLYSDQGTEVTIDFENEYADLLTLAVMLKSIGFRIDSDSSYVTYSPKTLKDILAGKVNPFIRPSEKKKKKSSNLDIESELFYSKENTERLKKNAEEMDKTGGTIHEVN